MSDEQAIHYTHPALIEQEKQHLEARSGTAWGYGEQMPLWARLTAQDKAEIRAIIREEVRAATQSLVPTVIKSIELDLRRSSGIRKT